MKNAFKFSVLLLPIVLILSCQKEHSNTNDTNTQPPPPAVTYDTASKFFFTASGITDTVQMRAIDDFVLALKKDSLWNKFFAIYPMLGGSAETCKWNLINPQDNDAAYRLTFHGSPVFAETGVLFPTTADYADTHLNDSVIGYYSSMSYYSRTQNAISGYDMGCSDQVYPFNELSIYSDATDTTNHADFTEWFGYRSNLNTPNTTGLFMLSSTDSNVVRYRNGVVSGENGSGPDHVFTNLTFWIGAARGGVDGQKECALATIGQAFTNDQAATFSNIVQTFETKLNRQ
jgi:hypothetical protein